MVYEHTCERWVWQLLEVCVEHYGHAVQRALIQLGEGGVTKASWTGHFTALCRVSADSHVDKKEGHPSRDNSMCNDPETRTFP